MDPNYLKNLQNLVGNAVNAVNITGSPSPSPAPMGMPSAQANSLSGFVTAGPSGSSGSSGPSGQKGKLKFVLVSTHCQQYTGYSKVSSWLFD